MPKHLTHAQIMTQLDPSDPATIQRLIDHRRAHFGDARMEADATSDDSHGDEVSEGREKRRADAAEARLKELDDAKLTDQQRLEAERDEYRSKADSAGATLAKYEAAEAAGIPLTWAKRLTGSTPEELLADAKSIKEQLAPSGPKPDPSQGGSGGRSGNTLADAMDDYRARKNPKH
ncbi:hypothetical protein [uncultured Dermacoccus sp.]|uniref:hypothetical protein n=1 Tax=uncultured Dermacoccus sp. TaxID=339343 RepID=UPI002596EBE3|nr:hypothetical protein [uncultured Dermacoccus sp.]